MMMMVNKLKTIEDKLGSVFNIMALIRTIIAVLFVFFALASCGTIECMYSEESWERHQIHFQENMDMLNCEWCVEYNEVRP